MGKMLGDKTHEAFGCLIVYPEGARPKRPADLPKKFTVAPRWVNEGLNPSYLGNSREWMQERCEIHNRQAMRRGWKTWKIVVVSAAEWRLQVAQDALTKWAKQHSNGDTLASWWTHFNCRGPWSVLAEDRDPKLTAHGHSEMFKIETTASVFDIIKGAIEAKLDSIETLRKAAIAYRKYLKKNPIDYTLPKGVPVLEEMLARQYDNTEEMQAIWQRRKERREAEKQKEAA